MLNGRDMLQDSQGHSADMRCYKDLLLELWSEEDVESWVTAFAECIAESKKAFHVIVAAAASKGQVSRSVLQQRCASEGEKPTPFRSASWPEHL